MRILRSTHPRLSVLFSSLCTAASLVAADFGAPVESVRESVLRMTEFFDTTLPGVLGKHNLALDFRPKFSDLRDYEYMRLPFELRYGLTNRWELRGGFSPFFPNPINSGKEHRWGLGETKVSARYDLGGFRDWIDSSTVGVEVRVPLGHPPVDLNDHYTHIKPFIATARRLDWWPATTFYTNLAYDRTFTLTDGSPIPPTVVRQDIIEVAPGLLYKPSEFGYFGEYRFRHIREDVGSRLAHELRAGAIWDMPLARSQQWKLPGKWQFELGYRVRLEESFQTDHGVSARVSWRTSLREVVGQRERASSR